MADTLIVAVEGLASLKDFEKLPEHVLVAARRAVNDTLARTQAESGRRIRQEVNFPASYVTGKEGRLATVKKASGRDLEGIIQARHRPTSLARFATSAGAKKGVFVEVKPGLARFMRRAFLIRLPAGASPITDTKFNLGLAIRLKPGETIQNKREVIRMSGNLYLLFGPSVAQVFSTVANDVSPAAADFLESEFLRLLEI